MKPGSLLFSILILFSLTVKSQIIKPCLSVTPNLSQSSVPVPNNAGKSVTICPGPNVTDDRFTLQISNCAATQVEASFITYQWILKNPSNNSIIYQSPWLAQSSIARSDTGRWVGKIRFNNGSKDTTAIDSFQVNYYAQPPMMSVSPFTSSNFSVSGNSSGATVSKCQSSSGTVYAQPNNLSAYEWTWSRNSTILSTANNMVFDINNSYPSPTTYYLTGIDNNSCRRKYPISVNLQNNPLNELNHTILNRCANDITQVTITNTLHSSNTGQSSPSVSSYQWRSGYPSVSTVISPTDNATNRQSVYLIHNGIDKTAPLDTFALPSTTTKYVARYTNIIGCYTEDTVIFNIVTTPVPNLGNDSLVCYGSNVSLNASVTGGLPPYSYSWSPSTNLSATNIKNPVVNTIQSNITYTVTITDSSPCGFTSQSDNIKLTVNPQIFPNVGADTVICYEPSGSVLMNAKATGGVGPYVYLWTPSDGLSATNTTNPTAIPSATTTYTFTVTDSKNCRASDDRKVTPYKPEIGSIPERIVVSEGKPFLIDIATGSNEGISVAWKNTSTMEIVSTSLQYEAKYKGPDTIAFAITLIDPANNCINRDTAIVLYISDNTVLYVPNIFSPGAQFVDNQRLKVFGDNISSDGFKFSIFNKWGQIVWETTSVNEAQEGWDGGPQIEGVYTYILQGKFNNEKPLTVNKEYMGSFKLSK